MGRSIKKIIIPLFILTFLFISNIVLAQPIIDIPLVKGAVYEFNIANFSGGNVDRGLIPKLTNALQSTSLSEKSVKSLTKASVSAQAVSQAYVGIKFRIKRAPYKNCENIHGRIKFSMYGIAYLGEMATLGTSGGSVFIDVKPSGNYPISQVEWIKVEPDAPILDETVFIAGNKQFSGVNKSKTYIVDVRYADKIIDFVLFIQTKAGVKPIEEISGNTVVDFYSNYYGAGYEKIKVEVLEAIPVCPGPGRYQ